MEIFFLRHGSAVEPESWAGSDRERPLTDEGERQMAQEAKGIAALGVRPDWIIASPFVRALQTAQPVARALGLEERLVADERLAPGFGLQALASLLQAYPKVESLMLVGHEPDFSETVARLIGGGRVECRKGSLARVRLEEAGASAGVLLWLLPPKPLSELGERRAPTARG